MEKQISTAMSDLALALSAVWGFRMMHNVPNHDFQFGRWWFMLETLAACLGVVRFSILLPSYHTGVVKYHKNFSWLCRAIGVPCLAAEICKLYQFTTASQGFLFSAVATFVTSSIKSHQKERVTNLVNGLSIIAILFLAVTNGSHNLVMVGLLFIITAVIGDEGELQIMKMLRIDILHYLLVAVNCFLVWGLRG